MRHSDWKSNVKSKILKQLRFVKQNEITYQGGATKLVCSNKNLRFYCILRQGVRV